MTGRPLEERMKDYEKTAESRLLKRMPVIIRVDGRAFHSYTSSLDKPFDAQFSDAMMHAAIDVAKTIQGFKLFYTQSDEISFLITDFDKLETNGHFGYDRDKLISITASTTSIIFSDLFNHPLGKSRLGVFDGRAFNMPIDEVANYFLWRARDWKRNSMQMLCESLFSPKSLIGKNWVERHEMARNAGSSWDDLDLRFRHGAFGWMKDGELFASCVYPAIYYDIEMLTKAVWPKLK